MAKEVEKLVDRIRGAGKARQASPFPGPDDPRILNMIVSGSSSGMELLDYVASFYAFSGREWERFVSGKRYRDIVSSGKPADKMKIIKGLLTMIKEENEPMPDQNVEKMIDAAANKDGAAFQSSFNSAIASKVSDAIDAARKDVAQNTFGGIKESVEKD
jgi:hypothetical protein